MMPVDVDREKLLNAILFFAQKVKFPVQAKIFKLLFLLDFIAFKQSAQTVTNLNYYTSRSGPIPFGFLDEIKSMEVPQDFKGALEIVPFQSIVLNTIDIEFRAKRSAMASVFSSREKKILDELVRTYEDASPHMMSEAAFLKNRPWKKTFEEKGDGVLIDYLLAIDSEARITREHAEAALQERRKKYLPPPQL